MAAKMVRQLAIQLTDVCVHYSTEDDPTITIESLYISPGERLFVIGDSGSGKSTLVNCIAGLIRPNRGEIRIGSTAITGLAHHHMDCFRANHIGLIGQQFNLIPYLSIIDNMMLPCLFSPQRRATVLADCKSIRAEAERLCLALDIQSVGLNKPVNQLSIGQQQRVAIARALIGKPEIIIADEPTSALDHRRKHQFIELLLRECESYNPTVIMVSHDQQLASHFDRTVTVSSQSIEHAAVPAMAI